MNPVRAAERLAAQDKVEEAVATLKSSLPENPPAPLALEAGRFLLDHDDPQSAALLLERAVAEAPENPAYPVFLALAHMDLDDAEKARDALRTALKMQKENRVARGLLAALAMREGNVALALRILDKAGIEASRRLIGRLLVEVERQIRRLEGTPKTVEEVVEPPEATPQEQERSTLMRISDSLIDPLVAQWLIGRAERALHKEKVTEARHLALRALARHADVPRGNYVLGVALLQEKEHASALRVLEKAEAVDGSTPDVLYARGCCLHEMGRLDEARDALQRMLAAFAKDAAACYTVGQIELQQDHPLEARRWFEKAAELDFLIVRMRMDRLRTLHRDAPDYDCPGTSSSDAE